MVDTLLNIANRTMQAAGLDDLTASEYNTSVERTPRFIRQTLYEEYNRLRRIRKDEFRHPLDICTTIAGQKDYTLSVLSENIDIAKVYRLENLPSYDVRLIYMTQDAVLIRSPNFDYTTSGTPTAFFFKDADTSPNKVLTLYPTPDNVWTIRAWVYDELAGLSATTQTICTLIGDQYLTKSLQWRLLMFEGRGGWEVFKAEADNLYLSYANENFNINQSGQNIGAPSQHWTNGGWGVGTSRYGSWGPISNF